MDDTASVDVSPRANVKVISGRLERDAMHFFQVFTQAWRSTRVRVSIEECNPYTAVVASFGSAPSPSRHDLLAPAAFDQAGNGTCGVDIITRPSFVRDGFWQFAVVGGSPLHGDRFFAGSPTILAFDAVVISEDVIYPTLDRGASKWGDCLRSIVKGPSGVPTITSVFGGESGWEGGATLPTVGSIPAAGNVSSDQGTTYVAKPLEGPPPWLGYYTVLSSDENVSIFFEVAASSANEGKTPAKRRRTPKAAAGGGHGGAGAGAEVPSAAKGPQRRRRADSSVTTLLPVRGDALDPGASAHGDRKRLLDLDGGACEITVCTAAGRVPAAGSGLKDGAGGMVEAERDSKAATICASVTVARDGTSASGVLQLPDRPLSGRWYLTARSACDSSSPRALHDESHAGSADEGDGAAAEEETIRAASPERGGRGEAGWGLEVLSLQRDWAHLEWKAEVLVPEGTEMGASPEACPWREEEGAFVLRAAAVAKACPRGSVGVNGVQLQPLRELERTSAATEGVVGAAEARFRFRCVATELPTLARRNEVDSVFEGHAHALSNVLFDEATAAAGDDHSKRSARSEYGEDSEEVASKWLWVGPDPPSLWYAVDMTGREVGAAVEVKVTVNSSAASQAFTDARPLQSRPGWRMGPALENGERDDFEDVDEASLNLTVALRFGELPVVNSQGNAEEDTWLLRAEDALREAIVIKDDLASAADTAESSASDPPGNWSTVFTWNVSHPPPLHPFGGTGLEGGAQATTLFVVLSAEVLTDGAATKSDVNASRQKALWAIGVAPQVTFRYCTEEICPSSRGFCRVSDRPSEDAGHVPVSTCHCFYGYGGEACAQRVVSRFWVLCQFVFLVGSNFAIIPGVRLALRLGSAAGAGPAVVLGLNGAASAFYHMCDLEVTCAFGLLSFRSLQALDFFFSFLSVAALVLHLCPMPWDEPLVASTPPTAEPSALTSGTGADASVVLGSADHVVADKEYPLDDAQGLLIGGGTGPASALGSGQLLPRPQNWGAVRTAGDATGTRLTPRDNLGGGDAATHGDRQRRRDARERETERGGLAEGEQLPDGSSPRGADTRSSGDGGTRLAALYVCLIPPLLVAVTNNPTAGVNLALVFAVCGGLLVFSWGRLVARDIAGHDIGGGLMTPAAGSSLEARWQEQRVGRDSEAWSPSPHFLEASPDGASDSSDDDEPGTDVGAQSGGGRGRQDRPRQASLPRSLLRSRALIGDRGGGGQVDTEEGVAIVAVTSSSTTPGGNPTEDPFSTERVEGAGAGVGVGVGSRTGTTTAAASVRRGRGWLARLRLVLSTKAGVGLRSLKRVTMETGLLDWRQLRRGALGFALGLACFAAQSASPAWYTLWHSAWHMFSMGSTVLLLRARRWGGVEPSSDAGARGDRSLWSRWRWWAFTRRRLAGRPVTPTCWARTYEMVSQS